MFARLKNIHPKSEAFMYLGIAIIGLIGLFWGYTGLQVHQEIEEALRRRERKDWLTPQQREAERRYHQVKIIAGGLMLLCSVAGLRAAYIKSGQPHAPSAWHRNPVVLTRISWGLFGVALVVLFIDVWLGFTGG